MRDKRSLTRTSGVGDYVFCAGALRLRAEGHEATSLLAASAMPSVKCFIALDEVRINSYIARQLKASTGVRTVGAVVNGMQRRDPMQGHAAQAGVAARLSTTNGNSRSVNVRYSSIGG